MTIPSFKILKKNAAERALGVLKRADPAVSRAKPVRGTNDFGFNIHKNLSIINRFSVLSFSEENGMGNT